MRCRQSGTAVLLKPTTQAADGVRSWLIFKETGCGGVRRGGERRCGAGEFRCTGAQSSVRNVAAVSGALPQAKCNLQSTKDQDRAQHTSY